MSSQINLSQNRSFEFTQKALGKILTGFYHRAGNDLFTSNCSKNKNFNVSITMPYY